MNFYHCYEACEIAQIFGVSVNDIRKLFHESGQAYDLVDLNSFEDITLDEAKMVTKEAKNENECSLNCESCNNQRCEYRHYVKIAKLGEKIIQAWVDGKVINPYFLIQWDH